MTYVLWTVACFAAYFVGVFIIVKVTPRLLAYSFDEGLFMGIAALDILGALLAFGAITVMFALFNGALAVKVLNFCLLVAVLILTIRLSMVSFRPRSLSGTFRASRIMAGSYCILLAIAAVIFILQLFAP